MDTRDFSERVLFLYLRDSKDSDHVATLARYKHGDMLTFAWAVNKVTTEQTFTREGKTTTTTVTRKVHDVFNKARGRKIAEGRLSCDRSSITVRMEEGDRPLRTMLYTLASYEEFEGVKIPAFLGNLAQKALNNYDLGMFLKGELAKAEAETVGV